MTSKPYRKGDRLIEFVVDSVFIVLEGLFWGLGFTDVLRELGDQVPENLSELKDRVSGLRHLKREQ